MKNYIITIILFALSKNLYAQPWKLIKDFGLAFQNSYDDYALYTKAKGKKVYYMGVDKSDTTKRIFDFEMIANYKDGWFNRIDTTHKQSYSIFFENGIAKRLSYTSVDSSVSMFAVDSNLLNGVHTIYYANGNIKEYGFYKNNARIGGWKFYNVAGKVASEGSFLGDYNKLIYDVKNSKLITLNKYLDTLKVEPFTQNKYDSLKKSLKQEWGMAFPIHLHFKTGLWKYYDDTGKMIKEEFYEKGKLIRTKKK